MALELTDAGAVVVSGLAKGVDTEALNAAIEAKGRTIGVIGTPITRAYPAENKRLQERLYREHLLISQFAPGKTVYPRNFPERNKLMAAISDATVIIEASDESGSLHQAAECTRLGRWLFIAKSLVDHPALRWPKDFLRYPTTRVLNRTSEIIDVLRGNQLCRSLWYVSVDTSATKPCLHPKISAPRNYQLPGFSVERLMKFLTALERDVEIVIRHKSRAGKGSRVLVTAA